MKLAGTPVLAFGTSGDQGSGLLDALTAQGAVPVVASSRQDTVAGHREAGRQAVVADLTSAESVTAAVERSGAAAAVLHVPLSLSSRGRGGAVVDAVEALTKAGLAVAVNLGTVVPPPGAPDPFGATALSQGLLAAGAAVLGVTAYLENHATPWAVPPLARGELLYPRPADDPVAWLTARDVTAAAVAALGHDLTGRVFQLAGPQVLTFDQLAAEFGAGLQTEIRYRQISADEFAELLRPVLGPAADGVAAGYRAMPAEPNPLMAPDAAAAWQELGVVPTAARDWAVRALAPRVTRALAPRVTRERLASTRGR